MFEVVDDFVLPVLRGGRVLIRPGRQEDGDALRALVEEPSVRTWWTLNEDMDDEVAWLARQHVIEIDGEFAGWLGVGVEDEPDYRHAGLDIALTTSHQNRGHGRE